MSDDASTSPAEHSLILLNEEGLTNEACFSSVLDAALPEIFSKEGLTGIAIAGYTDASHSAALPVGDRGGDWEEDKRILYERLRRLLAGSFDATVKSWPLESSEDLEAHGLFDDLVRLPEGLETLDEGLGVDIARSWFVAMMAALTKNERHRALILESCSLKGPHAVVIGKMLALNTSITELYLNDNEVGHGGPQGLRLILNPSQGVATSSSRLTKLWLVNNGLHEEDGVVIGEALAREGCPLLELVLSDNYLGAAGAAAVLEGLASNHSSSHLEHLALDDNAIGVDDEDCLKRVVVSLKSMPPSLKRLNVAVNGIDDCERVVESFPGIITEANVTCTVTYEE